MPALRYALWVAVPLLQLTIVVRMLYRRMQREFPAFFTYMAFHAVRSLLLIGLRSWPGTPYRVYFYSFWVSECLGAALGIAVAYEIYQQIFTSYPGLQRLGRLMFHGCASVMVLVAVWAGASSSAPGFARVVSSLLVLSMGSMVVRVGLIGFLFAFASTLRLTWRHYAFGIAMGLGLYTSVELAASAANLVLGSALTMTHQVIRSAAYNCALLVWLSSLLKREAIGVEAPSVSGAELTQWNNVLAEFLGR